jgi:D-alanine-D-alanine ligase
LCFDRAAAREQCRRLQVSYACPVLVEEFLPGVEVTVGVRGNGAAATVLGLMEIEPTDESERYFLYCVETKRDFRRRVRYHLPPRLAPLELEALRNYALTAYRVLGCRDLARFDFRSDAAGRPRFMECNPLPGLNPESGDIVIMSRAVLPYEALVQGILLDAAQRVGVPIA